jgi:hypothetical protein
MRPKTRTAASLCPALFCAKPASKTGHPAFVTVCAQHTAVRRMGVRIALPAATIVNVLFKVLDTSHLLMVCVDARRSASARAAPNLTH